MALSLLLGLGMAVSAATANTERPAAPALGCLDARAVLQAHQLDPRRLLVQTEQARYALTLAEHCDAGKGAEVALLSPNGWVCGGRAAVEAVRVDRSLCAIETVATITAKTFASEIRRADIRKTGGTTPTLDEVAVTAKAPDRSRFLRSSSYCFNPSLVRAWSDDDQGLVVHTAPRRSGGHRYYRVELGQSCPELGFAGAVSFHSGVGGAICGNAGDYAKPIRGIPSGFAAGGIQGQRFTQGGCPIVAVYPVRSPSES